MTKRMNCNAHLLFSEEQLAEIEQDFTKGIKPKDDAYFPIRIYVPIHVKKYVLKMYGGKLRYSPNNYIGNILRMELGNTHPPLTDKPTKRTRHYINCYILRYDYNKVMLLEKHGKYLRKRIEVHLDRLFTNSLIAFCIAQNQLGIAVKQAVYNYLDYLDIDDSEFSHDSAVKRWQMWKKYNRVGLGCK